MWQWLRARRRRWVTALVVVVALMAASRMRQRLPEVEVAAAVRGPLTLTIAASGKVESVASDLSFNDVGRIVEVYVHEGDRIHQEQPLARIEAGASLTATGPADVIRAPYDGWVVSIAQREGAVVQPGQAVLHVVRDGAVWVTGFIDSEDAAYLDEGDPFTCRAGGYLARPWRLKVSRIGHEAVPRDDVPGSARQVRIRFRPLEGDFALAVGTPVDLDGEVELVQDALLIPAPAVVRRDGRSLVWVCANRRVSERSIETGANNFRRIAVTRGLSAGEEVVVQGKTGLKDGALVRPIRPESAQP